MSYDGLVITKLEHAFDSISQHDYVKYTKKNIKEIKLA